MPKILKHFLDPDANRYVFQPAEDLVVEDQPPKEPETQAEEISAEEQHKKLLEDPEATEEEKEISFARVQAEAILRDAREEAEAWKAEQRAAFEAELEEAREAARSEGYDRGYAEGMASALEEGRQQRQDMTREQIAEVQRFLEEAAREKVRMIDACREELKDLAIAIAEKVIRVSLKNSSDIILRMVDAATDTHKKCEWAHVYVADCDMGGRAFTVPELTAALGHISNRIRVIPMANDESGTCIVELPDVILDASVSTQLDNIKEVLSGATLDKD